MKLRKILAAVVIMATVFFISCKPKPADIQKSLQGKEATGISVEVKDDGTAILTGEVADDAAKAKAEQIAKDEKGVNTVVNDLTVAVPVVFTPPVIAVDDVLAKGVTDATKDFATVKSEVKDGIVWLTGEIKKTDLPKLMMALNTLKPKKIENKLIIK